jgi:hypothetical protein
MAGDGSMKYNKYARMHIYICICMYVRVCKGIAFSIASVTAASSLAKAASTKDSLYKEAHS